MRSKLHLLLLYTHTRPYNCHFDHHPTPPRPFIIALIIMIIPTMLLSQLICFILVTRLSLVLRMLVEQFDMQQLCNKHALTAKSNSEEYPPYAMRVGDSSEWGVPF